MESWIKAKKFGPFKTGDFVLRKRKSYGGDFFKCHPLSFGQIVDFVKEDGITRPEAPHSQYAKSWTEVLVQPYDKEMAPLKEDGWIQWCPSEIIKIPKFAYCFLGLFWWFIKNLYRKPLNGQITDY